MPTFGVKCRPFDSTSFTCARARACMPLLSTLSLSRRRNPRRVPLPHSQAGLAGRAAPGSRRRGSASTSKQRRWARGRKGSERELRGSGARGDRPFDPPLPPLVPCLVLRLISSTSKQKSRKSRPSHTRGRQGGAPGSKRRGRASTSLAVPWGARASGHGEIAPSPPPREGSPRPSSGAFSSAPLLSSQPPPLRRAVVANSRPAAPECAWG